MPTRFARSSHVKALKRPALLADLDILNVIYHITGPHLSPANCQAPWSKEINSRGGADLSQPVSRQSSVVSRQSARAQQTPPVGKRRVPCMDLLLLHRLLPARAFVGRPPGPFVPPRSIGASCNFKACPDNVLRAQESCRASEGVVRRLRGDGAPATIFW